jgi:hypothetical protein
VEQCTVQPETVWCQVECTTVRAQFWPWCEEGYVYDPEQNK